MATKFKPTKVQLLIQGSGGESYAGLVDRKVYEFFKKNKYDLEEYASDWDGEWNDLVPEDLQPFPPGSPYECDGLWHASGAELSDLNEVSIFDEKNREVWVHSLDIEGLTSVGVVVDEGGGGDLDDLNDGDVVFTGGQGEKGCFFDAEFTLNEPFNPGKLEITFENCNGWKLITGVQYDGEELDGSGGYSTTGKWAENKFIIIGNESVYDSISLDERDDESSDAEDEGFASFKDQVEAVAKSKEKPAVTDWFAKGIKPVYVGTYEAVIDAAWPKSGVRMVEWTGKAWLEDGEKIKIKSWRGLKQKS